MRTGLSGLASGLTGLNSEPSNPDAEDPTNSLLWDASPADPLIYNSTPTDFIIWG